jgi:hypothetical protein
VCGLTLEGLTLRCMGCGGRWVYGVCTDVLGAVAEKVTGLRFDQFMQERILGKQSCLDREQSLCGVSRRHAQHLTAWLLCGPCCMQSP